MPPENVYRLPSPDAAAATEDVPSIGNDQSDFLRRLEELERRLAEAESRQAKSNNNNGRFKPTFTPTAEIQADAAWFNQDPLNKLVVGDAEDGVDFRRARIGGFGNLSELTDYRVEWEFAGQGRPNFLDLYGTIKELPFLQNVRAGHFFVPFSLGRIYSNRFDVFMERPLPTVFAPARRTGVMTFGHTEDKSMTWAADVYGGGSDNFGDIVTDTAGWAGAGRVTWAPIYDEPSDGRYYLHLGAAYVYGGAADHVLRFGTAPELRLIEGNMVEPIFIDTGFFPARRYQLMGTEFLWNNGPWSVQSEYMWVPVDALGGPNFTFQGAYVLATYFLTGEHRPYKRYNRKLWMRS